MAQSGFSSTWGPGGGDGVSGSRRKRVFEYLKAANELRQTYTSQWSTQRNDPNEDYYNTPGAFPDVEIARAGDEEMVLFPSYARRLTEKRKAEVYAQQRQRQESWPEMIDEYCGESDVGDFYGAGWKDSDLEDAVVDVDVRGWIYAPSRGPMSRKHRLMIALARKLSGIPAPTATTNDDSTDKTTGKGEDEYVDKQMQSLVDTAEKDADPAWKSSSTGDRGRGAASQPDPLSKDELSMANAHLMERLRPFLTNPVAGMPVTVFFFNDTESKSRNLMTDESGHFSLRAALPFAPTHIRVLASEDLSAARPLEIIEPVGISLISDIDDTVKHSAIAGGAKEMFRNTFVRELSELTVDGVSEWYTQLAKQGVEIHYVSNAPWQLYPLLERYFKMVGLPPGSFHLKQYTGMLQGIFEPTAERKRGSLEQILRDFPERKFILVGDSGEADLEVYTDIVLANPGRILGIFIRDVTTPDNKQFFEKSVSHLEPTNMRSRSTPQLVDHTDSSADRPALPPRRPREPSPLPGDDDAKSIENGDLIDLRDEIDESPASVNPRAAPAKPSKPSSLRAVAAPPGESESNAQAPPDAIRRKPVPPVPPRRSATTKTDSLNDLDTPSSTRSNHEASGTQAPPPPLHSKPKPSPPVPPPRRTNTASPTVTSNSSVSTTPRPATATAAAAVKASYPAVAAQAALQYATERLNLSQSPSLGLRQSPSNQSLGRTASNGYSSGGEPGTPAAPLPNRREELWRRRWERASQVLDDHGVVLGSWRVGSDAQPVCFWLVDGVLKEMQGKAKSSGRS
ncbi:hypothetical protein NUU61_004577 [Penicillium alfredii]|uniref:Phosphatidate phosphatase APP1 catalytic domain-containing protein n=1 Tax=Penicillium alfredii TaxID=1506179 RepID=A0A9W9FLF2_9EURO|nr:uncharacterized protein NUU61_004577 [Penicillium alfredii]KAJ5102355.1 hypothetical protein NUU61_004577 [Penicillium alfredii]